MNIEIRCNNCDKHLIILNKTLVPGMDTLRLDVAPCGNVDCNNCKDCEDAEVALALKEKNVQLENKLKNMKEHIQ